MADHGVRLTTKNLLIRSIELEFDVKVDGGVLGTLAISEGGLQLRERGKEKAHGIAISWQEFAEWAQS